MKNGLDIADKLFMDHVTATFIAYFGLATVLGVVSNFHKPIGISIASAASAAVVLSSFFLQLFAGPLMIFALFYAAPYSAGRFSYQAIRHIIGGCQTSKEHSLRRVS